MDLTFSLSMNTDLVRKVRAETRAHDAWFAETNRRRAEMLGKGDGFLRTTGTGYDFGSNPDPDGIMATNRDPAVTVPLARIPGPSHPAYENRTERTEPAVAARKTRARKASPKANLGPAESEKREHREHLESIITAPKRLPARTRRFPQFGDL